MSDQEKHVLDDVPFNFSINGKDYSLDLIEAETELESEPILMDGDTKRWVPLFQKWLTIKEIPTLSFSKHSN